MKQEIIADLSRITEEEQAILDGKTEVEKNRSQIALKGELPSPIHAPEGCKFCTRCAYAKDICKKQPPEMKEIGNGHKVACHLF